jgi:hypothetical protein
MTQRGKLGYKFLANEESIKLIEHFSKRGNISKFVKKNGLNKDVVNEWRKKNLYPRYTISFIENLDLVEENKRLKKENAALARRLARFYKCICLFERKINKQENDND